MTDGSTPEQWISLHYGSPDDPRLKERRGDIVRHDFPKAVNTGSSVTDGLTLEQLRVFEKQYGWVDRPDVHNAHFELEAELGPGWNNDGQEPGPG